MNDSVHKLTIAKSLLVAIAITACAPAFCQTIYNVDSTADLVDDNPGNGVCHAANGHCTLRAAVMEANRSASGSVIALPAGTYKLQIPPAAAYTDTTGAFKLTAPVTGSPLIIISGANSASTIIDANQLDRVLIVDSLRSSQINSVTLRGGNSPDVGGGIVNAGTLDLNSVIVSSNHAALQGGGIYNSGVLKIGYSSVTDNNTPDNGGGINSDGNGSLTLTASTVASNNGYQGGGLYNGGSLKINNSTIAQNQAAIAGGGIFAAQAASASALIHSSTIAFNRAYTQDPGDGGGIYILSGSSVTLRNSLLAGNYYYGQPDAFEDCYTDGTAVLNTFSGNFLWTPASCNTNGGPAQLNSLQYLGQLQDNGGPTQTVALLSGSNAIDGGNICFDTNGVTLVTDQRGSARLVGNRCDAGAYELSDYIFINGFDGDGG